MVEHITPTHLANVLRKIKNSEVNSDGDDESSFCGDSLDGDYYERPLERWPPLGAASIPSPSCSRDEIEKLSETERLQGLEEEQEKLNLSLLSLTTHFAQVQFRLKQIVNAPSAEKEELLKELEEFAFKGIPDNSGCKERYGQAFDIQTPQEHNMLMQKQRQKQMELISQLKSQLEDLETFAYQTGEAENIPTSQVLEKQRVVIDQLKSIVPFKNLEDFEKLSPEELRGAVDRAIGEMLYPGRVKAKLVDQLKTQIVDLERFIEFLQGETQNTEEANCVHCKKESKVLDQEVTGSKNNKSVRDQTISLMRHAVTMLQIYALSQFGCGGRDFESNLLKRTAKGNHWGDLRARLEITISKSMELGRKASAVRGPLHSTGSTSEMITTEYDTNLLSVVRKELSVSLRDLLQHGLVEVEHVRSIVPFGCLSTKGQLKSLEMVHAWQLFLKYYDAKHGKEYNEAPARKLSMAFSLEMVGGKSITSKQMLLSAIEEVVTSHRPLKRNEEQQWKAFVCLALNQKKLSSWLRIVLRCTWLVDYYYQPWSYVVKTGFDDALESLDALTKIDFQLPTDLAIRPFNNIKDAF